MGCLRCWERLSQVVTWDINGSYMKGIDGYDVRNPVVRASKSSQSGIYGLVKQTTGMSGLPQE